MGDNQRGSIKSVLIWLLILFVILGGTWVFLFYFFGLPIPLLTFFGWGNVYYECIPHECSELKEENNCNVAVVASQHRNCLWIENTCKKDTCASYNTQTSCKNALLGRKCSWIKNKCQELSCRNYKTEDSCNLQQGTLSDMDCIWGGNYCEERKCSSLETEELCQNAPTELGCRWVDSDKRCTEKKCYDYANKKTCEEKSFCKWENLGTPNEECGYKRCEDYTKESNCLKDSSGCVWYNNRCGDENCGGSFYANKEKCESLYLEQGCTWDKEKEDCQSVKESCNYYKNKTICEILPLCLWSEEMEGCTVKRKCSDYRYDYAGCTDETDNLECTWSDNPDAYFGPCIRKTCNGYDKRGSCLNISKDLNCDWIRNKCRSRGEALCRELKSLQCNGHPLCKWQKVYKPPRLRWQ